MSRGKSYANIEGTANPESNIAGCFIDDFNVREKVIKVGVACGQNVLGQIDHSIIISQREHVIVERRGLEQHSFVILSNLFFAQQQNRFGRFECLEKYD
jgi:hypothetical protein